MRDSPYPNTTIQRLFFIFLGAGTTCFTAVIAARELETKRNVNRIDIITIPALSFGAHQTKNSGNLTKEDD